MARLSIGNGESTVKIFYENPAAVMNTTRIYPTTPPAGSELKGCCKATDANRDNLTYYYKWVRNGVELISGVSSSSYTQGTEQMVSKLVGASYSVGDQMTFRCLANDGNSNSSWMSAIVTAGNSQEGGGVSSGGSGDTGTEYVSLGDEEQEEVNTTEVSDQGDANQVNSTAENEDHKAG